MLTLSIVLVVLLAVVTGCSFEDVFDIAEEPAIKGGNLSVNFIDVGQGDSIFIRFPDNKTMLIDGGTRSQGKKVVEYLHSQKIDCIDVIIGTHPHEDHIGGLSDVINTFDVGKVYLPKVTHTTKTFKDLLLAIKENNLKITPAKGNDRIPISDDVKVEILAPNKDNYDNLNNYSIVVKIIYNNTSFLFTGDAESISEKEMLAASYNLKSDVLKVGHHGSNTSTKSNFLKTVSPKVAVICAAKNNDYGHPHKEVIKRLEKADVKIYYTYNGNINMESDGYNINIMQ